MLRAIPRYLGRALHLLPPLLMRAPVVGNIGPFETLKTRFQGVERRRGLCSHRRIQIDQQQFAIRLDSAEQEVAMRIILQSAVQPHRE